MDIQKIKELMSAVSKRPFEQMNGLGLRDPEWDRNRSDALFDTPWKEIWLESPSGEMYSGYSNTPELQAKQLAEVEFAANALNLMPLLVELWETTKYFIENDVRDPKIEAILQKLQDHEAL